MVVSTSRCNDLFLCFSITSRNEIRVLIIGVRPKSGQGWGNIRDELNGRERGCTDAVSKNREFFGG